MVDVAGAEKAGGELKVRIPLKSISLALKGAEVDDTRDALRVLDIILRQQAANMYHPLGFL